MMARRETIETNREEGRVWKATLEIWTIAE